MNEAYIKGFDEELGKVSEEKKKFWIQGAIKKPGALKKTLGVKKDEKIPPSKLEEAKEEGGPKTKKRAILAENLRKMNKEAYAIAFQEELQKLGYTPQKDRGPNLLKSTLIGGGAGAATGLGLSGLALGRAHRIMMRGGAGPLTGFIGRKGILTILGTGVGTLGAVGAGLGLGIGALARAIRRRRE